MDFNGYIRKELFKLQDCKYKSFHQKLIPNINPDYVIGVRTPVLKRFQKSMEKSICDNYLDCLPHEYYEENNLHAFIINEIKDFDEYIVHLDTGYVEKCSMPKDAELFTNYSETFSTIKDATGWFSDNCISFGGKTYYLTCSEGAVKDMGHVCINNNNPEESEFNFVFNYIPKLAVNQIPEYSPSDIKDIKKVELIYNGIVYPLADDTKLKEIEVMFSTASRIKMGGTACPFDAELVFTKNNGEKGIVTIATDSCAVYKSKDIYYDYSEKDNSDLLWYFGLDFSTLRNLAYPKSYADNAEIALLNFFSAFEISLYIMYGGFPNM